MSNKYSKSMLTEFLMILNQKTMVEKGVSFYVFCHSCENRFYS